MISDDFVPPKNWDKDLLNIRPGWSQGEFVVRINDCNNSAQDKKFTLPILTRSRYERFGYVLWPEYESMYSDTEFGECAEMDGVVINAKTLLFEHMHPTCFKRSEDDIDRQHSNPERWDRGEAIYKRRKASGFGLEIDRTPLLQGPKDHKPGNKPGNTIDLIKAYSRYVIEVKNPFFSISIEGSLWLEDFLKKSKYTSAIDIGANFSGVVLASCGLDTHITDCYGPDVDKADIFLKSLGLSATKTSMNPQEKYDVVFVNAYDANSPQRLDLITNVAPNLVKDGGVIILNDGHFINVRRAMDKMTSIGWTSSVPDQTMDRYERFWMVLTH